jgi:hypothetical protein
MSDRLDDLREAIRRPLPLAYHPLYQFYPGGSLTRAFRGLPESPDDWWSEDWVGSVTRAGNDDPDGRGPGISTVDLPGPGAGLIGGCPAESEDLPAARLGDCPIRSIPLGPHPGHIHGLAGGAWTAHGRGYGEESTYEHLRDDVVTTPGDTEGARR